MGSVLTGREKKLTWKDFGTPVKKPTPAPGQVAVAAHTEVNYTFSINAKRSGKEFELEDSVKIGIYLDTHKSWVADWVFTQSQQFQDDLLNHEQGHYDLAALMYRDMFLELMQMKGQTFATTTELQKEINRIQASYATQKVHDKYDLPSEANHGRNATQQKVWDSYFQKAKTTPRTPEVKTPDGVLYRVTLLEVLAAAGKKP